MIPLIVDLDGTLIHTDMLHESVLKIFRDSPWEIARIPRWLSQGKAVLKQKLEHRLDFDVKTLPYNRELIDWLKKEKSTGKKLILCTATDRAIAILIADHLKIFDEIIASDGQINIAGNHKADALEQRFGHGGFDYVGNSNADLAVWQRARRAVVVNASAHLTKKVADICQVTQIFPTKKKDLSVWMRVLRVHQWLKNLLLFVPMLAEHQLTNANSWFLLFLAFFSFSLCASSVYIVNDLLDLESDRQHPRKRNRPFAAGQIPVWMGMVLAPVLFIVSFSLGLLISGSFLYWLMGYFLLTCAYSWYLKRLILIDCLTLAALYTLRIIAGGGPQLKTSLLSGCWLLPSFSFYPSHSSSVMLN